jgi:glycerophosphoryl diester phosphodiesterase
MIMGHRGAAALEPENTLRSIERAMEIGVDAVEIDVRLSKDRKLVVIHDSTVDRTWQRPDHTHSSGGYGLDWQQGEASH